MKKIMEIRNLVKSFGRKDYESQVLKGINTGHSGAGLCCHHGAERRRKIDSSEYALYAGQTDQGADISGWGGCYKSGQ